MNVLTSPTAITHLGNLRYIASFQRGVGIVTPVACIILGAQAVAGARGEGYLKTTVIQPVSRQEVLIGKAGGRAAGLSVPLSLALLIGYLHGAISGHAPPVLSTVGFAAMSALYVGTLMIAMIGLSAVFKRAITPAGTAFVLGGGAFLFYDNLLPIPLKAIYGVREGSSSTGTGLSVSSAQSNAPIAISTFLERLLPTSSYYTLTNWVLGLPNTDSLSIFIIQDLTPRVTALGVVNLSEVYSGQSVPIYLHPLISGVVLVAASAIVFLLGYISFKKSDLQ